jgi:hypothetical protein
MEAPSRLEMRFVHVSLRRLWRCAVERRMIFVVLLAANFLVAVGTAHAHHSWQLDHSKALTLSGIVTRFDFANPHVQLYFDVKDESGSVATWQAGGPSPNQLARGGWSRDTLKPGDKVTVMGYRNKDGAKVLRFDTITLPDGKVIEGYRRGYRGR